MIFRDGRYWAHYGELEEYAAGMWRRVAGEEERERLIAVGVAFLTDDAVFVAAMRRVLDEWPNSRKVAFSTPTLNKPVWLAHAGAALVRSVPEELMRLAYWRLDIPQRERADALCQATYSEWVAELESPLFR